MYAKLQWEALLNDKVDFQDTTPCYALFLNQGQGQQPIPPRILIALFPDALKQIVAYGHQRPKPAKVTRLRLSPICSW